MAAPGFWGDEFLVNTVTAGAQISPVVTALANGRFAIAYTDFSRSTAFGSTDRSDSAVRLQVFSGDGTAFGAPIQVNTVTKYHQHSPRIAPLADGGFVVTYSDLSIGWDSYNDDLWEEAVRMQRFSADAIKVGSETRVNTTVYGDQDYANVALLDNGNFLVTWDDGDWDGDENINAQLFDPNGNFLGGEVRLNADADGSQTGSEIAALPGGGYAVIWVDASGADGDVGGIFARVFSADGTPVTADLQVNTTTAGDQYQPSVTALAGGGFFVVWTDNSRGVETGGDDTSSYALRGQVFDAAGAPVGGEFRVNQTTTYGQVQPDVLALSDGRFIVTYSDTSMGLETGGDDAAYGAIRARIFHTDGSPDGDEFLVNVTTEGHQNEPQLAELPDGRVVFTWTDYSYGAQTGGDDPDNGAIRARILDLRDSGVIWSGGDGDDRFIGTGWNDVLNGASGNDTLAGADGDDRLYGRMGADILDGDRGADILSGHNGRDILRGGSGADFLHGGRGNDDLRGGAGGDRIKGGDGKDVIQGCMGADVLTGGRGADVFVYVDRDESGTGIATRDTITDFTRGIDRIDLSAIDADPLTAQDDAFVFLGRGGFDGHLGDLRFSRGYGRTVVKMDLDGDKVADMTIVLTGGHDLHAGDFIL